MIFLVLMTVIWSLKAFDYIFIMTQGGPAGSSEVVSTLMYKQAFNEYEAGYAAALGLSMTVVTAVVLAVYQYLRKKGWEDDEHAVIDRPRVSAPRRSRPKQPSSAGAARRLPRADRAGAVRDRAAGRGGVQRVQEQRRDRRQPARAADLAQPATTSPRRGPRGDFATTMRNSAIICARLGASAPA